MVWRVLLLCIFTSSCLAGEQVLKEHVRDKFLQYQNTIRSVKERQPLSWSKDLAADANMNALRLGVNCFTNDTGNERANILQVWGSRDFSINRVIVEWLTDLKSRAVILNETLNKVGCSYTACKDPSSYATSVIYVCHYGRKS